MKSRIFLCVFIFAVICSCSPKPEYIYNEGFVYGTIYHFVYQSPNGKDLKPAIENRLKELDLIFSTFNKESEISKVNTNQPVNLSGLFINCFNKAQEVSQISGGAFDITVAPLVNAWGFGFKNKDTITGVLIDSLKNITGYQKVRLDGCRIVKDNPAIMLDMSAIAKGYTCDLIGDFLAGKGCKNYMVEIGGEVVAKGANREGKAWSIGISKPVDDALSINNEYQAIVSLPAHGLATSGNYRNFYIENGKKYAHTIDPKTGYPVQHSLLSATVLASDCMTADAFATAFMVLGIEKSIELSKQLPGIEVYLIYAGEDGSNKVYTSENFKFEPAE